jgi:N-acetylglutamate synthase-like GNAT family acetyltransferase
MAFLVREFVPGVGATVLRACREQAAAAGMSDVLLSTTAQFLAAHRFYEKSGFSRIPPEALPTHFPRMRLNTRFYRYRLAAGETVRSIRHADERSGPPPLYR